MSTKHTTHPPPDHVPVGVGQEGVFPEVLLVLLHRQLQSQTGLSEDGLRGIRGPERKEGGTRTRVGVIVLALLAVCIQKL